ncbi:flavin-containing monooxygenase FMO GS-OX4-like [Pelobates cultripes]|uniref:Flavin-containing monooxygenase n=1 Tax=Pelobates cultripes TaxID=61616 RepID=A0AAD1RIY8_PELCU|nr:flavin-containing monooxygenase FMO GS-OX4-like [Pelobates cultripes]
MEKMSPNRIRVAVIGAGGAGLCAARHLLSRPHTFQPPVVFEISSQVGGTWLYTEVSENESHQHSSTYRNLRTNLPKEIMEFPDFSFDPSLPSFIHHSEVLRYLEEYTDNFNIRPHIRFNSRVTGVSPVLRDGECGQVPWDVTSHTQGNSHPVTERFDAVTVCVGHYSHPYIPDIPGIDTFQGKLLHSHSYRYPEMFTSRSVALLGCGPSGVDIAHELAPYAQQVTLCHRGPPPKWTPPTGVTLAPTVVGATPHHLICEDGSQLEADTLIFCTGYKYYYPFLMKKKEPRMLKNTEENGETIVKECFESDSIMNRTGLLLATQEELESIELMKCKDRLELSKKNTNWFMMNDELVVPNEGQGHLPPLYKHLIHALYPTMCFIGACKIVLPFPLCHYQVLLFLAVLEGKCLLPSPEQMLSESLDELKNHLSLQLPLKFLHRPDLWEYKHWLAETAGFEPLPPVMKKILETCKQWMEINPVSYRDFNFEVLSKDEFRVMQGDATILVEPVSSIGSFES